MTDGRRVCTVRAECMEKVEYTVKVEYMDQAEYTVKVEYTDLAEYMERAECTGRILGEAGTVLHEAMCR